MEAATTPSVEFNRRVLVVDDEAEIRSFFHDFLSDYQVCTAVDGSEVPPLLSSFRPHLVITDLRMPRQGGLAVIELVKAYDSATEVLVITGYGRIEEAVEAMRLGASDFIPKPFDIEQMRLAIEKCFERVRLRQQNVALQRSNQELRHLMELKEKFLRITSHELRGPLTILQGYCDLLGMVADSPREVREAQAAMQGAISSLTTIVRNLTTLMTASDKCLPIQRQPFDVMAVLHTVLEDIKVCAKHRQHQYYLSGPAELPALGDPLRVTQVVYELLFNAVKFTPDRGEIHVHVIPEEHLFTIDVQDNGIGMAAGEVVTAFEPFYEVASTQHHSTSRTNFKGGGLGIGLTLVREIVGAYGGRVAIVSERGKGTKVTVSFPLDSAQPLTPTSFSPT